MNILISILVHKCRYFFISQTIFAEQVKFLFLIYETVLQNSFSNVNAHLLTFAFCISANLMDKKCISLFSLAFSCSKPDHLFGLYELHIQFLVFLPIFQLD